MLGAPAKAERDEKRILLGLEHLPELLKDVKRIKRQLGMKDEPARGGVPAA